MVRFLLLSIFVKYFISLFINKPKYFFCQEALTIYQKSHIDVSIENEICTIEILKDPYINEKFISSGINIYVFNKQPLCKLKMEFDIKLDTKEKEVFLRIYTGIKWFTYENYLLTTDFIKIKIEEDFNLENTSKWRLITTSRKIGQKIVIKNFKVSY